MNSTKTNSYTTLRKDKSCAVTVLAINTQRGIQHIWQNCTLHTEYSSTRILPFSVQVGSSPIVIYFIWWTYNTLVLTPCGKIFRMLYTNNKFGSKFNLHIQLYMYSMACFSLCSCCIIISLIFTFFVLPVKAKEKKTKKTYKNHEITV